MVASVVFGLLILLIYNQYEKTAVGIEVSSQ